MIRNASIAFKETIAQFVIFRFTLSIHRSHLRPTAPNRHELAQLLGTPLIQVVRQNSRDPPASCLVFHAILSLFLFLPFSLALALSLSLSSREPVLNVTRVGFRVSMEHLQCGQEARLICVGVGAAVRDSRRVLTRHSCSREGEGARGRAERRKSDEEDGGDNGTRPIVQEFANNSKRG